MLRVSRGGLLVCCTQSPIDPHFCCLLPTLQVDSGTVEATKIKVLGPMPMATSSRVFVKADLGVSGALEECLKNAGQWDLWRQEVWTAVDGISEYDEGPVIKSDTVCVFFTLSTISSPAPQ